MNTDPGVSIIVGNTVAMHEAFARVLKCRTLDTQGVAAIDSATPAHRRAIVTDPDRSTATIMAALEGFFSPGSPWVVEDPFGRFDGTAMGLTRVDRTVLFLRDPGHAEDPDPGTPLRRVTGPDDLALAERIIATAFERADLAAEPAGTLYPAGITDEPGVSIMLGGDPGEDPVGTVLSFYDDHSVGFYWGGVMHGRRRGGICTDILKALEKERNHVPSLGSSGAMSQSLFRSGRYRELGMSSWWSPLPLAR